MVSKFMSLQLMNIMKHSLDPQLAHPKSQRNNKNNKFSIMNL